MSDTPVERIHVGLVDGIPRQKPDGAYVYYYDYEQLERRLREAIGSREAIRLSELEMKQRAERAEAALAKAQEQINAAGQRTSGNEYGSSVGSHSLYPAASDSTPQAEDS